MLARFRCVCSFASRVLLIELMEVVEFSTDVFGQTPLLMILFPLGLLSLDVKTYEYMPALPVY